MDAKLKPNFTAWFVMQGVIATMHQPLFASATNDASLELYAPLASAASKTRLISRIIYNLPYRLQYAIGDLVTNRGRLRHFYLRKKQIEKQVRELLVAGNVKQVVVLGAGLDVLSLRLAREYPDVLFIEIDTEESQRFKQAAFAAQKVVLPSNVATVAGDLRNPLQDILAGSTFASSKKTVWIAEGFFMFIPESSVVRILQEIKALCSAGAHIVFTSLPSKKVTSSAAYLLQSVYLKKEKSPFEWVIPFNDAPSFVEKIQYKMVSQISHDELHKNYSCCGGHKENSIGENIHLARLDVT